MSSYNYEINGENIRLENFYQLSHHPEINMQLSETSKVLMTESLQYIQSRIQNGEVMYGVNTGFGAFSSVRISDSEIEQLQKNLIRSHSVGIGEPFDLYQTRGMMILRANTLARGHSGIRPEVVLKILEFLNHNIIPVIPSQGSVGASGDLAPLSHLALALMGEGDAWEWSEAIPFNQVEKNQLFKVPVSEILQKKNLKPLELKAKEGLSLINGCQVMTAVGLLALKEARELIKLADIAGAMSLEGLTGSRKPFDPLIAATRPHYGESETSRNLMKILGETSPISESHAINDVRVQDAYSLRCMPAVHGAVKQAYHYAQRVLEVEANSSTDNPLVFASENKVLSCGNFHGMPVAHAMDFMGMTVSSLASISEARISKMISTQMSQLPAFLAPQGGLNSGHMIVQVAAASLVSENKVLAHPASVDSIPTSAEKEDHVSMGTIAARKFNQILKNAQYVIAMEFLSATQAICMLSPLQPAAGALAAYECIRKKVPFAKEDRVFSKDIELILSMMKSGEILKATEDSVGQIEV